VVLVVMTLVKKKRLKEGAFSEESSLKKFLCSKFLHPASLNI
jgi:hypothetical protein